jgi:predicted transposase/invertase (TIGR01784 family)
MGKAVLTINPGRKTKRNLPEYLPPSVDVVFKCMFGDERNKDILADFLSAALGFKIAPGDITLVDPHLERDDVDDKQGILDVRLRLRNGKIVNIEMQVGNLKDIRKRAEYYISKMTASQMCKGDRYSELAPVVMILITTKSMLAETKEFHSRFKMLETAKHFELHDLRTLHVLELSKLPKKSGGDRLVDWLRFIKAKEREEFMTLAQECRHLCKALAALEMTSANERTRDLYEARLKAIRDEWARMDYVKYQARLATARSLRRGLAKGRAEGRAEGIKEVIALIKQGATAKEAEKILAKKIGAAKEKTHKEAPPPKKRWRRK